MESEKGLKAPEKIRIIGSLLHFKKKVEIRIILFSDTILCFQVFSYVREMPAYELLLKMFLCDPPGP